MTHTPTTAAVPAQLAPAESYATPEAAQAEYKRYMMSPEYLVAAQNPHGKGPATQRLAALAERAWGSPGQSPSATPKPGLTGQQHADLAVEQASGKALTPEQEQEMAAAYAPGSVNDFINAVPNDAHPYAGELRQMFFDDRISPSVANLVMQAPHMVQQASMLSDDDYFAACDKAAADVKALPNGRVLLRKAIDMVDALPDGHVYIPIAEALLTRSGGILEIAHWSDRLRARAAGR
jgi:hypothetical protein